MFKNGITNAPEEAWSDLPNIVNVELVEKINKKIHKNCCYTISELSIKFPQISENLLFSTVMQDIGDHKFCARWVPKLLSKNHKKQCIVASLAFLKAYNEHGEPLLDHNVTFSRLGKISWLERQNKSNEWGHTYSPRKLRKCSQILSRKIMVTISADRKMCFW